MAYNKKKTFDEADKKLEAVVEAIVKDIRSPKKVDPFAAARQKPGKSKGKVVTEKDIKGRAGTTTTKKPKVKPPYPVRASFATDAAFNAAVTEWERNWGKK